MKTLDINTIAFEYLLRTDSQKNKRAEEPIREVIEQRQKEYFKNQKSLLAQLYDLEEEDLFS